MPAQQVPGSTCPYPRPTHYYSMARFPLLSDQRHARVVIGEPSPRCGASVARRAADSTGPGSLHHRPDSPVRDHRGTATSLVAASMHVPRLEMHPDSLCYPPRCRSYCTLAMNPLSTATCADHLRLFPAENRGDGRYCAMWKGRKMCSSRRPATVARIFT